MWPWTGKEIREALGVPGEGAADAESFGGVAIDTEPWEPDDVLLALGLGGADGHAGVDAYFAGGGRLAIVASGWAGGLAPPERWKGREHRLLRVSDTYDAFWRLARAMRKRFSFPVVAIAGANGKTTTKDMMRAVLRGSSATAGTENGHYGVPRTLLDRVHGAANPPSALLIEIGIDAIGSMSKHAALTRPDVAVITSLGEEHLRGLLDAEHAAKEELELFAFRPRARRVLDISDTRLRALLAAQRAGDVTVVESRDDALTRVRGMPDASWVAYRIGTFDGTGRELSFDLRTNDTTSTGTLHVPLPGAHHARLAALAVAVGFAFGRTAREIEVGFQTFRAPTGRAQIKKLHRDVVCVDDTFNASPDSMRAAIALASEPVWAARPKALVLGDMLDLGDGSAAAHASLTPPLRSLRGAHLRLYGDAMAAVYRALTTAPNELASIAHAPSRADPVSLLDNVWASLEGALVIAKGSRGMRLERVVLAIERAYANPRPLPSRPPFATDYVSVGVTGTNGKSTTTSWIAAALSRKHKVARATTLGYFIDDERREHPLDWDGFVLALGEGHARGARVAALEVTSEALQHGFAKVWPFHVAVFTNLTHDHLDVHTTPEHYLASKAQLFMHLPQDGTAILNACDPASALLREVVPPGVRVMTYGVASRGEPNGDVDLFARVTTEGVGSRLVLERSARLRDFPAELRLHTVGDIFAENALAAALGAYAMGASSKDIVSALASPPPCGRFELVAERPYVIVDYAHTPDALERVIAAARALCSGRILLVFGAGGDRDTKKRGPMGEAAASADVIFLTSDNPRTEDPAEIARDLAAGLGTHAELVTELDRARAIERAIAMASSEDVVLICGKGHETEQILARGAIHFSDQEVALAAIARNRGSL